MPRISPSLAVLLLTASLPARAQQADTIARDSVEIHDGRAVSRPRSRDAEPLQEMPFRLRFFRASPAAAAEDDVRSLVTAAILSRDLLPTALPLEAPLPPVYLDVSVDLRERGGYRVEVECIDDRTPPTDPVGGLRSTRSAGGGGSPMQVGALIALQVARQADACRQHLR